MQKTPGLDNIQQNEPAEHSLEQVTVIGAGITGLMSALRLANEGHEVTVIDAIGIPDANSDSTSMNAIGQYLPWMPEDHRQSNTEGDSIESIIDTTRPFFEELSEDPEKTGVMKVVNLELLHEDNGPWPDNLDSAMEVNKTKLDTPISFQESDGSRTNMDTIYEFDTFSINPRVTLPYIAQMAVEAGVTFLQEKLSSGRLQELEGLVINAAGINADEFHEGAELEYFKGHTFVLDPSLAENPDDIRLPTIAFSAEDIIFMPRSDGTMVVGALYIEDPESLKPEKEESDEIHARVSSIVDTLIDNGLLPENTRDFVGKCPIRSNSVGWRVERKGSSVHVSADENNENLIHAYGLGGVGWTLSPHIASKVLSLVESRQRGDTKA